MTSQSGEKKIMNHKKYRAFLKKERRKRIRQEKAKLKAIEEVFIDENEDPLDDDLIQNINCDTEDTLKWIEDEDERVKQHRLWLEREIEAQIRFQNEQEMKRKQDEEQEYLENENSIEQDEDTLKQAPTTNSVEESLLLELSSQTNLAEDGPTSNPIAPLNFFKEQQVNYGTEQDRHNCPFFLKTGSCRFGDRCSRTHVKPSISTTLLIPGMYNHFSISECFNDEYDADIGLEYEDSETYQHFKEFYEDVFPEFKSVGEILQFKICCNHEPHLRGNVYVQYKTEEEALQALTKFNGRWYAGRQLSCEFTNVTKWRSAICGLFAQKRCPKGKSCNFLHVFRNPRNEFRDADFDWFPSSNHKRSNSNYHSKRHSRSPKNNRRSRSPFDDRHSKRSRHRSYSPVKKSRQKKKHSRSRKSPSYSSDSSSHSKRSKKKQKKHHRKKRKHHSP